MAIDSELPIYNKVSDGKKAAWKLRPIDKRVHFVPLIVILCFIIIWIFGSKMHQESITIEEDEYYNPEPIEIKKSKSTNETHVRVDLAMLSLATTPINVSDPEPLFRATPEITPSPVPVIGVTDLNPGSSASLSFGSGRLLIQEGNNSIEDEDFNDPVELKKPVSSIKETYVPVDLATTLMNASDPEPLFQASPEFEPSTGQVTRTTDLNPGSSASLNFGLGRELLQEGNVTINELSEIKKPESVKEKQSDFATLSVNASVLQPLFQANTEIAPLQSA